MKLQLLIATTDAGYSSSLSKALYKNYSDILQVSVCSTVELLHEQMNDNKYDSVLLDREFLFRFFPEVSQTLAIKVTELLLINDFSFFMRDQSEHMLRINTKNLEKYQRVSFFVQELMSFANVTIEQTNSTQITVVWSPAGGTGKSTVAMAYATKKTSEKKVVYLDLGYFSSVPVYFKSSNKGISWVFSQLDGNLNGIHLEGVAEVDSSTGVIFFGCPDNYDDMNVLTLLQIESLIKSVAAIADEVVLDMPVVCNEMTKKVFDLASKIFIVSDVSLSSKQKLLQFCTQSNVYSLNKEKITLVANKGSVISWDGTQIKLPLVQSNDDIIIFKTLSTKM